MSQERLGLLDRLAGIVTVVTDWAIGRTDRRAQLDALLAELEGNLGALEKMGDRANYEWQRTASSRHLTPELRRIVQRAYRLLDTYQRRIDLWHNPPPPEPGVIQPLGAGSFWRRSDVEKAAKDAQPHIRYAISCVSAHAVRKPLPLPPAEVQ